MTGRSRRMRRNSLLIFRRGNSTKEKQDGIVQQAGQKAGHMQQDDHSLVKSAQAGDRRAFAMLVERHYRSMFKIAWQWCGNREDAEDIAQDSAIKIAQNIRSFSFDAAFTTWMYRIVINAAKDYYKAKNRRGSREMPLFDDVEYVSGAPDPERQAQSKDVLRIIHALPESLRETVVLVCWHGMSHKEAGAVLDCPEGTISWRVSEARKKIAAELDMQKKGKRHG